MITEIELENIRIFENPQTFYLRNLSVFCGVNNSGKSTVLKTLLLLRQSHGLNEGSTIYNGRLRFSGSQIDLGNYSTFISHNDINREISVTLTIRDKLPIAIFKRLCSLKTNEEEKLLLSDIKEEDYITYQMKVRFLFDIVRMEDIGLGRKKTESDDNSPLSKSSRTGILKSTDYEVSVKNTDILRWGIVLAGIADIEDENEAFYHLIMPKNYFDIVGGSQLMEVDHQKGDNVVFFTTLRGLLPSSIIAKRKLVEDNKNSDSVKKGQLSAFAILPYMEDMLQDLQKALSNIHYLGPLRSPAKRYYIALDIGSDMDPSGDFLPYILRDKGQTKVLNIRPGQRWNHREEPLSVALNSWLHYLRTGEEFSQDISDYEITVSTTRDVLVEFKVKTVRGIESHALADSGFGYSQVLPIIVKGLLANEGSTLIIEQPELHLNPALQVRLAEFFVAMARAGKQVLIETHSEHIVNMIRVLAVEDESGEIASNCGILYIDIEGNRPIIYDLSIKPDGTIGEWPQNFFGEAVLLTGRLLRAQKRFRDNYSRSK